MCLGIPGKVVTVRDEHGIRIATVDFGGVTKSVCLAYVPDVGVGDYTIVHAGFAITQLDERSALDTLALFGELGMLEEDEFGERSPAGRASPDTGGDLTGPAS
ncbi:MAG: HypC/HybG/HupF family hydrogenase formation chaperone [Solirubrobacteraceae bacterium]|jgi:hydrogenase expression/formation protein HypC